MTTVIVGIPTLNGHERLDRCLRSIADSTPDLTGVKVLVHDDASTPEGTKLNKDAIHRAERLRAEAGLEMLISPRRVGIATGWNRLCRHSKADVCVLLNDDVEVTPHWLDVLTYSVMHNKHIGMVGLNAYYGVTRLQVEVEGRRPLDIDYQEARLLTGSGVLLSTHGYAFAFRREVYDEVDGFDERYFMFYEECDFGVALRRKGYCHVMATYPIIYHVGGATTTHLNPSEHMARSAKLFHEKWGKSFAELREEMPASVLYAKAEWNTQLGNWK